MGILNKFTDFRRESKPFAFGSCAIKVHVKFLLESVPLAMQDECHLARIGNATNNGFDACKNLAIAKTDLDKFVIANNEINGSI